MGYPTGQMPQVVLIEPTKQEHALNKEIRCNVVPACKKCGLTGKELNTTRNPSCYSHVSRKCTHIILGMSAPLTSLHLLRGCLSSQAAQSSAEKWGLFLLFWGLIIKFVFYKVLEIPGEIEVWAFILPAVTLGQLCYVMQASPGFCQSVLHWNDVFICMVLAVFTGCSLHPQINNVILVTEVQSVPVELICYHPKLLSMM